MKTENFFIQLGDFTIYFNRRSYGPGRFSTTLYFCPEGKRIDLGSWPCANPNVSEVLFSVRAKNVDIQPSDKDILWLKKAIKSKKFFTVKREDLSLWAGVQS
jgi:hypothetical protein